MNNRKYLLLLCLILTALSAETSNAAVDSCGQIPALRAKLAALPNVAWAGVKYLSGEIARLERECDSERTHRDSFLDRLSGFSSLAFYQRMNALLAAFDWKGIVRNEGLKRRFLEFGDALINKNLSFIFEPENETQYAALRLDLMRTANQFTLALMQGLDIDMNEIYDVDALFSRIEQGLASLTK